jgi:alpha-tubulin suppressor-like RCC1 family protein
METDIYGYTPSQRMVLQRKQIQTNFQFSLTSKIDIGENHSIMVLPDNQIACKGDNYYGQLGNHIRNVSVYMHKHPLTIAKINRDDAHTNKVVSGNSCSFVLTSSGAIYSWGKNSNGILGHGHSKMITFPTQISPALHSNLPIALLDVKYDSAIALSTSGQVFTWGNKAKFTPDSEDDPLVGSYVSVNKPTLVPEFVHSNPNHRIIDVCAGENFYLALTKDRMNLLTWGYSCCYNLHKRNHQKTGGIVRVRGMRLGMGRYITTFSAGSEHALASLSVGQVYSWGNHESGAMGRRQNSDVYHPQAISRLKENIKKVSAGSYHSLFLSTNDNVYMSGRMCGEKNYTPIFVANNIADIRCSMYNAIMIDTTNNIFVWGANNNGQIDTQPEHSPLVTKPIPFEYV